MGLNLNIFGQKESSNNVSNNSISDVSNDALVPITIDELVAEYDSFYEKEKGDTKPWQEL